MSVSAAVKYEVRWRVTGTEQWSDIAPCSPVGEIVVEGLDRTKQYDFEVRAVSACGARSAWGTGSNTVPTAPPGTLVLADIATEASAAQASAAAANAELANIASDNIVSAAEKPTVIRDWSVISSEQAGIDAQAVSFLGAASAQQVAYDNAISALATYLGTLTSPKMWNDKTGDTTVVGATFRANFNSVYVTRQTLLNAIYAAAKTKADAAQTTANQGVAIAVQVPIVNPNFDALPAGYGWVADAGSGWVTDMTGITPGGGTGCAKHVGSGSTPSGSYRNIGRCPCQPGQVVKFQALIKASGANGYCTPTISFQDASGTEITSAYGALITGTVTTGSFVSQPAPAGTVVAVAQLTVNGHTTGTYLCDNTATNLQPSNIGEVPDGGGRYAVNQVDGSGLAIIDFSQGAHVNKNLDYIADSTLYKRMLASATAEAVDNPDFEASATILPPPGWISGGGVTYGYTTSSAYSGARSLILTATSTFGLLSSVRQYPCVPGEQYLVSAVIANNAVSGNTSSVYMQFFDKTGASLSFGGVSNALAPGTGYQVLTQLVTVPANAVTFRLDLILSGVSGGQSFFDNIRLSRVRSLANEVNGTLSTQKNLPSVTFGNYGSGWSGLSLTYTATTTSATISASAATLQAGGDAISYSASSITLSGTAGTVVKYYLYYADAGMTGGSKTLQATTNQITALSNNSYVLLGTCTVTYPTSGTGGGSGGSGCPVREAWVIRRGANGAQERVRAGTIVAGDDLRLARGGWGRVTYSAPKLVPCVRVTVNNHGPFSLSCSRTAPLGLCGGDSVLATESLGESVRVLHPVAALGATVTSVDSIGMRWVQHITCEDDFFWAGDDPDCLFSHHNLKPP